MIPSQDLSLARKIIGPAVIDPTAKKLASAFASATGPCLVGVIVGVGVGVGVLVGVGVGVSLGCSVGLGSGVSLGTLVGDGVGVIVGGSVAVRGDIHCRGLPGEAGEVPPVAADSATASVAVSDSACEAVVGVGGLPASRPLSRTPSPAPAPRGAAPEGRSIRATNIAGHRRSILRLPTRS